jgi:hypothetical protein
MRIKTAHGYLSFQPDGRIEYRPTGDGAWENFDIEGLVLQPPPGTQPVDPGIPPPFEWGPPPSPNVQYIAAVKAQLEREGFDLSGACGAFAITQRAAWGLRRLGYGLLFKDWGNNCRGFATDILMLADGRIFDILGDAGNGNRPLFNEVEPVEAHRWRAAVQP